MTFRFPFQISRAVSLYQSKQIPNLLPSFQKNGFNLQHVSCLGTTSRNQRYSCNVKRNSLVHLNAHSRQISKQINYKLIPLPLKLYPSESFIQQRHYSSNEENREKVRLKQKCDDKSTKQNYLTFRETTRDECEKCLGNVVVDSCRELARPKRAYDPSKMKWNHGPCPEENKCNIDPPRMDDIVGVKVGKKKLPSLSKLKDCKPCINTVPKNAPKLIRPKKLYDASKMKWDHGPCKVDETCDIDSPRMDNVRGYKVKQKTLPKLPSQDECRLCSDVIATKAPDLVLPKRRYDPSKLKWQHICPKEEICNVDPPRMDNVLAYKVTQKKLPKLYKLGDCEQCLDLTPKSDPKLPTLKKRYDTSKMKWKHDICPSEVTCDVDPPRMDDVKGYKVKQKKLPDLLKNDDCKQCKDMVPKDSPKLERLEKRYDPMKMKWQHGPCPEDDTCNINPPRMDDVLCWKPKKKKLPSFSPQNRDFSTLGLMNYKQTTTPKYQTFSKTNYTNRLMQRAQFEFRRNYSSKSSKKSSQSGSTKNKYDCEDKKPSKPKCAKFKLAKCKPRARLNCDEREIKPCKKVEPPYGSFGECFEGWDEPIPTECEIENEKTLQPKNQRSGEIIVMKPPPPHIKHVDPALERKCLEKKACEKEPPEVVQETFKSSCKHMKLARCKPRYRQFCDERISKPCTKINAPYDSFTDQCPQFPDLELSECDIAEIYARKSRIDYSGKDTKIMEEEKCAPEAEETVETEKECKKESSAPKKESSDSSKQSPDPKLANPTCGSGEKKESKTSGKQSKSNICQSSSLPPPSGKKEKVEEKKGKIPCVIKANKTIPKGCPADKQETKEVVCVRKSLPKPKSKDKSKDVCKSKSEDINKSKCKDICKPKQSKEKEVAPAKKSSKCQVKLNNPGCGFPKQSGKKKPPSLWQRIVAFFRARPNCPAPDEWKKKKLREKAKKAAQAAGLEICEPISKRCKLPSKPKNEKPDPCKPKRVSNSTTTQAKKSQSSSCCRSAGKKASSDPKKASTGKNKSLPKVVCGPPKNMPGPSQGKKQSSGKGQLATPSCSGKKDTKKFSTFIIKRRNFSTYTILSRDPITKQTEKQILANLTKLDKDNNLTNYSKCADTYQYPGYKINNYIGKIYQLKLMKIGVRNALIKKNDEEEPYTVCYICKFVPRNGVAQQETQNKIKNMNVTRTSERRQSF